jgi:hypothetical protein
VALRFAAGVDGPGFEDVAAALAEEDEAVAHPVSVRLSAWSGATGIGSVVGCGGFPGDALMI